MLRFVCILSVFLLGTLPFSGMASVFDQLAQIKEALENNSGSIPIVIPHDAKAATEKDFQQRKADYLTGLYLPASFSCDARTRATVREFFLRYNDRRYYDYWNELVPRFAAAVKRYPDRQELKVLQAAVLQLAEKDQEAEEIFLKLQEDGKNSKNLSSFQRFFAAYHLGCTEKALRKNSDSSFLSSREAITQAVKEGMFKDIAGAQIAYRLIDGANLWQMWEYFCDETANSAINPWLKSIANGELSIKKAWAARGNDCANKVTPEGWRGFELHLNNACKELTSAWQAHPERPEAAARMITVAMAGHANKGDSEQLWFNRAVKAQMDYALAYKYMLWALRPRWGGSHEQMIKFGLAALNTGRFDTEVPMWYYFSLMDVTAEQPVMFWTAWFHRKEVKDNLIKLFEQKLKQPQLEVSLQLNRARYAVAMIAAGDLDRAGKLMHLIPAEFPFCRLHLPGWLAYDRAGWEHELEFRRSPTGQQLESVEQLLSSNQTDEALSLLDRTVRQTKDPGAKKHLLDVLGYFVMEYDVETVIHARPAICAAACDGSTEKVAILLDYGASPETVTPDGITPLIFAARNNANTETAKLLLQHGAKVNNATSTNYTPLMAAAINDNPDMLNLLIKAGADVNSVNLENGQTALHYAVVNCNRMESIQTLIRNGAKLDIPEKNEGFTPLLMASRYQCFDALELLLENGADFKIADRWQQNALHFIALYSDNEKIAMKLIDGGISLTDCNSRKFNPLHLALINNHLNVAKLVASRMKDLNARGENDYSALDFAADLPSTEMVACLLDRGADINAVASNGMTALHRAAIDNHWNTVKLLLERGADRNIRDKAGKTAAEYARKPKVIKLLTVESSVQVRTQLRH